MKVAMIYMASGFGRRFGSNKLLAQLEGRPLYQHGLICLQQAAARLMEQQGIETEIIAVSQYEEILREARRRGLTAVYNGGSAEGMAASLRLGTRAAAAGGAEAFFYFVADAPRLTPATLTAFAAGFLASGRRAGCVQSGGSRGNPAAFSRSCEEELLALRGDRGGRPLLEKYAAELWLFEVPAGELRDIDRPEDLTGMGDRGNETGDRSYEDRRKNRDGSAGERAE